MDKFKFEDAWFLTALSYTKGSNSLVNLIEMADIINRAIIMHCEINSAIAKLKYCDIVEIINDYPSITTFGERIIKEIKIQQQASEAYSPFDATKLLQQLLKRVRFRETVDTQDFIALHSYDNALACYFEKTNQT